MEEAPNSNTKVPDIDERDLLALKPTANEVHVHRPGNKIICRTDYRVSQKSPTRIVTHVNATDGFIPLWERNMFLKWKFDEASVAVFQRPEAIKNRIRELLKKLFHLGRMPFRSGSVKTPTIPISGSLWSTTMTAPFKDAFLLKPFFRIVVAIRFTSFQKCSNKPNKSKWKH